MAYTKGVLKVMMISGCACLTDAKDVADSAGQECFAYNGDIYIKLESARVKRTWCKSPFKIEDFEI